jgi:hypothetical protein
MGLWVCVCLGYDYCRVVRGPVVTRDSRANFSNRAMFVYPRDTKIRSTTHTTDQLYFNPYLEDEVLSRTPRHRQDSRVHPNCPSLVSRALGSAYSLSRICVSAILLPLVGLRESMPSHLSFLDVLVSTNTMQPLRWLKLLLRKDGSVSLLPGREDMRRLWVVFLAVRLQ